MKKFIVMSLFSFLAGGYLSGQDISHYPLDNIGCAPVTVEFSVLDMSIFNNADSAIWNWGDGNYIKWTPSSPYVDNINRLFSSAGNFNVTLTVYVGGTPTVYQEAVTILPRPVFSFVASADTICPNTSNTFTPTIISPSGAASYFWDFGDGTTGTEQNPTHTYISSPANNVPMDMNVKLTVNINGCAAMVDAVDLFHIRMKPEAKFKVDNPSLCFNKNGSDTKTANFTDTSFSPTPNNNTYLWTFGDGGTSTQRNPSHNYTGEGVWNVSLLITDAYGCVDTLTKPNYIRLSKVVTRGSLSDTILCRRGASTVAYANFTANELSMGWVSRWYFTHPTSGSSDGVGNVIVKTYNTAGHFTVLQIVSTEYTGGCSDTSIFTVHVFDTVTASIRVTDTNVCKPDTMIEFRDITVYKDNSDFGFDSVIWCFGDVNNTVLSSKNLYELYSYHQRKGEYTVKAVVTTPYGCVLDTVKQDIHIYPLRAYGVFVEPDPSNGPPEGCAPFYVKVANFPDSLKTTSPIIDYTWYWDWESQTDTANPHKFSTGLNDNAEHVYHDTGVFRIVMKLTNAQGCWDTIRLNPLVKVGWIPFYDWFWDSTLMACRLDSLGGQEFQVMVHAFPILDDHGGDTWLKRYSMSWDNVPDTACNGNISSYFKRHRNGSNYKPTLVDSVIWNILTNIPDIGAPFNGYQIIDNSRMGDRTSCESHYWNEPDTLGWAVANNWTWLDKDGNPLGTGKDFNLSSPPGAGWFKASMVPSHNGCKGPQVTYDSISFLCPPKAGIKAPEPEKPLKYLYSCGLPCLDSICPNPSHKHDYSLGALEDGSDKGLKHFWYFDDSSTRKIDGTWTSYISDTIVNDSMPEPQFCYELGVYDSIGGYPMGMVVTISLISINDDTVACIGNATNPNYNPCGVCRDSASIPLQIAVALPNLTSDRRKPHPYDTSASAKFSKVCVDDAIHFVDSSWSNWVIADWLLLVKPTNVAKNDFPVAGMAAPGIFIVNLDDPNYRDGDTTRKKPLPWEGQSFPLPNFNTYKIYLLNQDLNALPVQACQWWDSMEVTVVARSEPEYQSGRRFTPPASAMKEQKWYEWEGEPGYWYDTLCINARDSLCVQGFERSTSPNINANEWRWKLYDEFQNLVDSSSGRKGVLRAYRGGIYDVELTVSNHEGCDSTHLFAQRALFNEVVPGFSFIKSGPKIFCSNSEVGVTNLSRLEPEGFSNHDSCFIQTIWNWGDGTPTTRQRFHNRSDKNDRITHHIYSPKNLPDTLNTIVIQITVSAYRDQAYLKPYPCSATYYDTIIVRRPIANYTDLGHSYPCVGDTGIIVRFFDSSLGQVHNWFWDFGDGSNPSYDTNPVHIYTTAGSYDVMLLVMDNGGCYDSIRKSGHVLIDGPSGNYKFAPDAGCVKLQVKFESSPPITRCDSVYIYGGDGTYKRASGMAMNGIINYIYSTGGYFIPYYSLFKTVGDSLCRVNLFSRDTIWVLDFTPEFQFDSLYCPDMPITFTNTTNIVEPKQLGIDSIWWDFGNGETDSIYERPTQYNTPGFYTITLTEKMKNCIKTVSHQIEVINIPNLTFGENDADACNGRPVKFYPENLTPEDSLNIVEFIWAFDDGDTLVGNPAWREEFPMSAIYNFAVDVIFKPTGCIKTYYDAVDVKVHIPPTADFEAEPSEVPVGENVQFTDKTIPGSGTIATYNWNFGDGDTLSVNGSDGNVTHAYSNTSGYVTVSLEVIDQYGCRGNAEKQILITEELAFPNMFTPIGYDKSYVFRPMENKGFFEEFKLEVYDRWGVLVWKRHCTDGSGPCPDYTNDSFWWDGKNKQGNYVSDGVYYWVIYAKPLSGAKPIVINGSVTIANAK